jgi:hypothetical protein
MANPMLFPESWRGLRGEDKSARQKKQIISNWVQKMSKNNGILVSRKKTNYLATFPC